MKTTLLVLFLALTFEAAHAHEPAPATNVAAPVKTDDADAELVAVANAYRGALERLDLKALHALHTEDVVIFEQGYRNDGWKDYEKNHIGPELKEMKAFKFTKYEARAQRIGDAGLVYVDMSYTIDGTDGTKHEADGLMTLVLRRTAGTLQIAHAHSSTHKRPAAK